jgi:hypothetical protein
VLNDALSVYFADATLASAFVARWCVGLRLRQREACFKGATMHRRHGSAPGRIRHPKGGEIMSAGREITPGPLWLGMEAQQET